EPAPQLSLAGERPGAEESRQAAPDPRGSRDDRARGGRGAARVKSAFERAAREAGPPRHAAARGTRALRARVPPAAAAPLRRQGGPAREARRHGAHAPLPKAALTRRRLPPVPDRRLNKKSCQTKKIVSDTIFPAEKRVRHALAQAREKWCLTRFFLSDTIFFSRPSSSGF